MLLSFISSEVQPPRKRGKAKIFREKEGNTRLSKYIVQSVPATLDLRWRHCAFPGALPTKAAGELIPCTFSLLLVILRKAAQNTGSQTSAGICIRVY